MKRLLKPAGRARWLAIVCGLAYGSPLLAQPLPFSGRWLVDDGLAAGGSHPILVIKDATMAWKGTDRSAPACAQPFELKKERPGTVYTDARGTKFVAGTPGSIPTYLLRLSPGTCDNPAEEVRISYPLIYDVNHIEVVEYVAGKPVSARRLRRKK